MCPPGVDQTTRIDQRWQLTAPDLKHNMPFIRNFWNRDDNNSEGKFMANLFYMFARPLSTPKGSGIPLPQPSQSCGFFDLLSNEIFDMILLHLDEKEDITALGSYSEDLPPALAEDKAFVEEFSEPTRWEGIHARSFYCTEAELPPAITAQDQAREYAEAMKIHLIESRIGETQLEIIEKDLAVPKPEGKDWVLRNLTTREIVYSEKLDRRGGLTGLEHVLLRQITWTSMLRYGDVSKYRGKWAGHRFDIVPLVVHAKEGGDWKDVSAEKMLESEQHGGW